MQTPVEVNPGRRAGVNQGAALIALGTLVTMAIVSLVPNLPQLLQRFSNVPGFEFWVPMIITVPSLCIALFSPLAGMLADRWGRRPVLLIALLFYALVGILPLLVDSLFGVIATRVGIGVMEASILTCGNALMGDYFAGRDRDKWLGYQATVGPIFASALMLAGGSLGTISWKGPFALYALGLPMLLWAAWALWEPARSAAAVPDAAPQVTKPAGSSGPFPWRITWLTSVVTLGVAILYYVQAVQLGRMFAEHGVASPDRISIFTSIASIGVMAGGYGYRFIAPAGIRRTLALLLACMGLGYGGVALTSSAWAALPFAVLSQVGNGLTLPALLSWTLGKYSFEQRGRGMGIWGSCFFAATFLSPLCVTWLSRSSGGFLNTLLWMGTVSMAASVLTLWFARGRAPARATA